MVFPRFRVRAVRHRGRVSGEFVVPIREVLPAGVDERDQRIWYGHTGVAATARMQHRGCALTTLACWKSGTRERRGAGRRRSCEGKPGSRPWGGHFTGTSCSRSHENRRVRITMRDVWARMGEHGDAGAADMSVMTDPLYAHLTERLGRAVARAAIGRSPVRHRGGHHRGVGRAARTPSPSP